MRVHLRDKAGPPGRGSDHNPANRFETLRYEHEAEEDGPPAHPDTRLLRDPSRSILAHNESPDLGFETSLNPYRGCEHGCSYCYARPTHEYLGFSAGLDFETRILVKEDAPRLLREAFEKPSWKPRVIALSGVTDPYQPAEHKLGLTRRLLEVFLEYRNPLTIVTKNGQISRDLDLLAELARLDLVSVSLSVTTLDRGLQERMEPRASSPTRRLAAIERLAEAAVPVGVLVAPVIPGLTESEMPAIVRAAADRGAAFAGYVLLRLPHGLKALFERWLERNVPERRDKVLGRLREMRGGRLYDSRFGSRQRGEGIHADGIEALFAAACRRSGVEHRQAVLSTARFCRPADAQLGLFD